MELRVLNSPKVMPLTLTFLLVVLGNVLGQQPSTSPRPEFVTLDVDDFWHGVMSENDTDVKAQIDSLTKARYLLFPHIYRAFIDAGRSPDNYNVSSECKNDLTRYYWALNKQKAWAWRLYDATGKQGAGLFHGALTWKGNFQECLNTLGYKTTNNFFTHDPDQPQAQYCSVFLQSPAWLKEAVDNLDLPFPVPMPPFISDICVPVTCSEDDLSRIVQRFVSSNTWGNMNFTVTDTRCFKGRRIQDDPAALCTAIVLLALVSAVGLGTLYDIYLRRLKRRIKHGSEFQIGYRKDTKQYGILKVILAAPSTKSKLQRRYTITGYEKPDNYKLQEIKVHRQKLMEQRRGSGSDHTLPDSGSIASDSQSSPTSSSFHAFKHGARPYVQRSVSEPSEEDQAAQHYTGSDHPPTTSKNKDEFLPTVEETNDDENGNGNSNGNGNNSVADDVSESDTSSAEEDTKMSDDDDDLESQANSGDNEKGQKVNPEGDLESGSASKLKVTNGAAAVNGGDNATPLSPTAGIEFIDEEGPFSQKGQGQGQGQDEAKNSTQDTNSTHNENTDDAADVTSPLITNGNTNNENDDVDDDDKGIMIGKSPTKTVNDDDKKPNSDEVVDDDGDATTATAATTPDTSVSKSPVLTPDDVTDDNSPLLSPAKPSANGKDKPKNKAVSMLKSLSLHQRSHSDPCMLDKGEGEGKVESVPLTLPPMEITVPESKEHKFDAKVPWSPPHKKVTHRMTSHGPVYERQMSIMSEAPDPFASGAGEGDLGHKLYDIPEEPQDGKENGQLKPEVVIKERPQVTATAVGFLRGILLSFSFRKSTKRVMAEGSPDTLFCLNGVRVLSISWIVLGNVYMILYLNPDVVDNHVDGVKLTQTLWVQAVINTTLAADSFYILSGTLGAYNFMKLKKKFKGKSMKDVMTIKEYFMLMFHRLCRIGPCYWLVILLFTNLMPYMGKGPRWSYEITSVETCKKKWWANALFFSNFYQSDKMCMPHTYYLVNDFQFALLSPLFLIPLLCKPILGFILLGGLVALQILTTLILDHGINGNVLRMGETSYFSTIYVKPYCRIGVYAIGLGLGYLLWSTKRQMKFKRLPLTIMWLLSLFVIFTLPYITHLENKAGGRKWTGVETALYEALSRPLWGMALAWVIFACSTGQGAFINKLLSWNAFLPLCRITYGVYLLHPMLIAVVIESRHNGIYIDFAELTYEFVAHLVVSYLMAFVLITFVESPFTTLEGNIRAKLKDKGRKKH